MTLSKAVNNTLHKPLKFENSRYLSMNTLRPFCATSSDENRTKIVGNRTKPDKTKRARTVRVVGVNVAIVATVAIRRYLHTAHRPPDIECLLNFTSLLLFLEKKTFIPSPDAKIVRKNE